MTSEADIQRYVAASDDELRGMWREVLRREGAAKRSEFLPVETMLCFGLGLITPPSPSGHVNVRVADPRTKQLARLLGRPAGSLQSKHSNLEARVGRNGGRHTDPLVGNYFANHLDEFADLYARSIAAARKEGISGEMLVDFLGQGTGELQVVLDAGQLRETHLRTATEEPPLDQESGSAPRSTVKERLVEVRIAQQRFARAVLERSGFRCVFCGLGTRHVGLPSARMLVAGHIKPWRFSSTSERVSASNGFAACPTHDAAFENHLMTVGPDGDIQYTPKLQRAIAKDPSWSAAFSGVEPHVILSPAQLLESASYLRWHRSAPESPSEALLEQSLPRVP